MHVTTLTLKQFRCFNARTFLFNKSFVIVGGPNGSGKSSLLEALYYACYLRSFRTRTTRELICFDEPAFSLKLRVCNSPALNMTAQGKSAEEKVITVGYSQEKRIIKLNEIPLTSYKELLKIYRVIALTGDDAALIKGAPEYRRHFLDQAAMLSDPTHLVFLKKYAGILAQKNALLNQQTISRESYNLWTQQLEDASQVIRGRRQDIIALLESKVNELLKNYFDAPFTISLIYKPREKIDEKSGDMMYREQSMRHALFGAHLDDYTIMLADRTSKQYASKGQQKLIALLLKIAQPAATQNGSPCIFILDDILSDLDDDKIRRLCALLVSYKSQIIMTSPLDHPLLDEIGSKYDCQRIDINQDNKQNLRV